MTKPVPGVTNASALCDRPRVAVGLFPRKIRHVLRRFRLRRLSNVSSRKLPPIWYRARQAAYVAVARARARSAPHQPRVIPQRIVRVQRRLAFIASAKAFPSLNDNSLGRRTVRRRPGAPPRRCDTACRVSSKSSPWKSCARLERRDCPILPSIASVPLRFRADDGITGIKTRTIWTTSFEPWFSPFRDKPHPHARHDVSLGGPSSARAAELLVSIRSSWRKFRTSAFFSKRS